MSRTTAALIVVPFIAFVSLGLPDGLLGVAWPSMRERFGRSLDQLGVLLAISMLGYLLSSASFGYVSQRMGIGWLAAISTLLACLALFGYALAPEWVFVITSGFVLGIGSGCIDAAMNTYAAQHYSPRMVNWLHASYGVGTTLGPLILTVFAAQGLSWRYGYGAVGMLQGALALWMFVTVRAWARPVEPHPSCAGAALAAPSRASRWLLLRCLLTFFVYCGIEVSVGQWSYTLLTESRQMASTTAGIAVSVYWGGLTAGRFFFGWLVHHTGPVPLLRGSCLGAVVAAALLSASLGPIIDVIALAGFGLALASIYPLLMSTTPQRFGERTPKVVGLQVATATAGIMVFPLLAGILAERFGLEVIVQFVFGLTFVLAALHETLVAPAAPRTDEPVPYPPAPLP